MKREGFPVPLRAVVIGSSCSGKTTLAKHLAESFHVPHVELDRLYWGANWTPVEALLFRTQVRQHVEEENWIVDGNYSVIQDEVFQRANLILWLNLPLRVVFGRALFRSFVRILSREEIFAGNRETFLRTFGPRSLLWWILTSFRERNRRYRAIFDKRDRTQTQLIELCSISEVEHFVREIHKD